MAVATTASEDTAPASSEPSGRAQSYYVEIFLVSLAVLLLEISYTRIISHKLFYYFTYLVIGLALLGLGAGGVFVALSARLRRAATDSILVWCLLVGAAAVAVGYLLLAAAPVNTLVVWRYDGGTITNGGVLIGLCLVLFASFVPAGIILSTLFGRRPERFGRLYFVDLVGAALACAVAVPLQATIGPPRTVMLAGTALAIAGVRVALRMRGSFAFVAGLIAAVLGLLTIVPSLLPDVELDRGKHAGLLSEGKLVYSSWSPLFRVDVRDISPSQRLLFHDGLPGSVMLRWDGERASLDEFDFDEQVVSLPYSTKPDSPERILIIGAAAGREVVVALSREVDEINAVELNPVTHRLVTNKMADYNGHLADQPGVNYVNGDGRTYLARSDAKYDLILFPAPDSYSATNSSSASAFVLSESYLYTKDAIVDTLEHLTPDGLLVAQFGEVDFQTFPNRTARYLATTRAALRDLGIDDARRHMMVSTTPAPNSPDVTTILVKTTPFTPAEVARYQSSLPPGTEIAYVPVGENPATPATKTITATGAALARFRDNYRYSVGSITDDKPFFWHFAPFSDVVRDFAEPIGGGNVEVAVGERVLLLLLAIALLLATVFLLLPFVTVRRTWRLLPRKGPASLYFTAVGLGFMFFEITLIQRFVLFLGYPTYSLTVTLSSMLIFLGIGSLLSARVTTRSGGVPWWLVVALVLLTAYYLFGLTPTTDALLQLPLGVRIGTVVLLLAPLGLCLGLFMPLGVRAVAGLSEHSREYVAWAWAINGFASVIGSVLATILGMTYGFQTVLLVALIAYGIAIATLRFLARPTAAARA